MIRAVVLDTLALLFLMAVGLAVYTMWALS